MTPEQTAQALELCRLYSRPRWHDTDIGVLARAVLALTEQLAEANTVINTKLHLSDLTEQQGRLIVDRHDPEQEAYQRAKRPAMYEQQQPEPVSNVITRIWRANDGTQVMFEVNDGERLVTSDGHTLDWQKSIYFPEWAEVFPPVDPQPDLVDFFEDAARRLLSRYTVTRKPRETPDV